MSATRVLHPDLRVRLHKLVKRENVNGSIPASARYTGNDRVMDLTPFFSDIGSIHTTKSVRAPAGAFALVFTDKPYGDGATLETIYGMVEPMDAVEIRMAHNHAPSREPPLIMRGFVTSITRTQGVDERGAPHRSVTIHGHDYGKIWQMLRILWRPLHILGETWLSSFPLFERFGLAITTEKPAAEFVAEVFEKVLNPHLAGMLPDDWALPRVITTAGNDMLVDRGMTSVTGPQNHEGSIYQLLAHFADVEVGFNELFIEDRADSVACVFRPNPALDLDGRPIQMIAQRADVMPERRTLPASDIVTMTLSRSDQDVANFFWVEDPRFEMVRSFPLQFSAATSAQRETVYMTTYPNNLPSIYGIRPLIVATQMGDSRTFLSGQPAAADAQREQEGLRWLDERRRILTLTNRDNVLLESGTVQIAGNENIRAGTYIELGYGALAAPYYVAAVTHDYIPFKGYFTMLHLERGQGFARRIQMQGQSPWLTEMGAGAPPQRQDGATARTADPGRTQASVGQAGPANTPDSGTTPATQAGPPPSTATQPYQPPQQPIDRRGETMTPTWQPPPPTPSPGSPTPDWTSPTGWRDSAGNPTRPGGGS